MILREQADEVFSWGLGERQDDLVFAWENHSRGVAKVAERIAEKCGLDKDRAYAAGLLHDIGRYKGLNTGMMHIIYGYDLLMKKDLPELAKICLTHSFNPRDKVGEVTLPDDKKDAFLKDYMKNVKFDDYDKLIQLSDFMAGAHGITTIERRFCSVLWRHGLKNPVEDLTTIYGLKKYFDKKAGIDIYELFHEEISESPFRGIPGEIGGKKILISDEEI